MQKGYFYNVKRVLLQTKKGTFADQKGYFCNVRITFADTIISNSLPRLGFKAPQTYGPFWR